MLFTVASWGPLRATMVAPRMLRRQPILPKKVRRSPRKMLDRIALRESVGQAGCREWREGNVPDHDGESSEGRDEERLGEGVAGCQQTVSAVGTCVERETNATKLKISPMAMSVMPVHHLHSPSGQPK